MPSGILRITYSQLTRWRSTTAYRSVCFSTLYVHRERRVAPAHERQVVLRNVDSARDTITFYAQGGEESLRRAGVNESVRQEEGETLRFEKDESDLQK